MKKIMFNDKYRLTEAVLQKRKTMTRRLVPERVVIDGKVWAYPKENPYEALRAYILSKAPYKVGEIIAVSQSYKQLEMEIDRLGLPLNVKEEIKRHQGYKNKMYVKAEDMPHKIKIIGLKAEFIQDISDVDCFKEGIYSLSDTTSVHKPKTMYTFIGGRLFDKAQWAFRSLFIKTSGKRKEWEQNWWTYAYEFELVD